MTVFLLRGNSTHRSFGISGHFGIAGLSHDRYLGMAGLSHNRYFG
jgi:hypothetical protein